MENKDKNNLFIEKANVVHGNKYNYSKINYINSKTKIIIICPIHGEFEQIPNKHIIRKHGCPKCSKRKKHTKEYFIDVATSLHNNKYDYSLVDYINIKTKVIIICPIHGEFKQVPESHIKQGCGCPKCSKKYKYNNIDFIELSNVIHNNKYIYTKINYINNYTKINIICPTHGEFIQTPSNHLSGKGCNICGESKNELLIKEYLDKNNIIFIREHKFDECLYIRRLPFDFYLPEINTCIEFNGKQHYEPIDFFGGIDGFKKQVNRDNIKETFCKENNINLLKIKYDENPISKLIEYFNLSN